jgi:Zn finger protein HypA/HybF involved in hydrogenase expression
MSIPISKEKGINPALAKCCICGHDNGEILLLGDSNKYQCRKCDTQYVAYTTDRKNCPKCNSREYDVVSRDVDGLKDVIMGNPCDKCAEILKRANLLICPKCHTMEEITMHQATCEFDVRDYDGDVKKMIEAGVVKVLTGNVIRDHFCEKCEKIKEKNSDGG